MRLGNAKPTSSVLSGPPWRSWTSVHRWSTMTGRVPEPTGVAAVTSRPGPRSSRSRLVLEGLA